MKTLEYRTIDKSDWGEGPWQNEPDKLQYEDPGTGLPALIKRNNAGALCGYVGVPAGHPWHGKHYDDVDAAVHGGLTYSDGCQHGDDPSRGICHIPGEGESDNVWWLGFDCAHYLDVLPGMDAELRRLGFETERGHQYRDLDYVKNEIARLAVQARAAENDVY